MIFGQLVEPESVEKRQVSRKPNGHFVKGHKAGGRPKGSKSKINQLREALLDAVGCKQVTKLRRLKKLREDDPKTFYALVGRVLTASRDAPESIGSKQPLVIVNAGERPVSVCSANIVDGKLVDETDEH